jgi:hypothetical protein
LLASKQPHKEEKTFFSPFLSIIVVPTYSVFQGFSKAKYSNGGFDFKLEPIFDTAPAASKNEACFKSAQSQLKNNHLSTEDLNP